MVTERNGIRSSKMSVRTGGFLTLLARHWRLFLYSTLAGAIVFAVISLVIPQTYESTATVLPPEREGVGGMISMLAGASSALDLLKGGDNPTLDLFKTIVESRTVSEDVALDPRIRKYFTKKDTSNSAIAGAIQGNIKSEALRTGVFTITVDVKTDAMPNAKEVDSARVMSAYLANAYVNALDRFNRDRLLTSARATRIFIEGEYNNRLQQLDSSYGRLQAFQEKNNAVSLTDQLSATVTAAAGLTGKIQQLEMQLAVEQRELSPNSSHIQMLQEEIAAAKTQLQKYDQGGVGDYVLALKNVPELARSLAGYLRETKVLEQVTGYLRQELEQQRIAEQRDLPSLQVLDPAKPPLKRSSPSRTLMTILGAIVGFVVAAVIASMRRFVRSVRERPEQHYRLLNFLNTVKRGDNAKLYPPPASTENVSAQNILIEQD